eukprot:COSAG02_NODE_2212_length_9491_cov_210.102215_4_plen_53_part_00
MDGRAVRTAVPGRKGVGSDPIRPRASRAARHANARARSPPARRCTRVVRVPV